MGILVTATAQLQCSFGTDPGPLDVPEATVLCEDLPVATIEAIVPELNIPSFGMCNSLLNPEVETATAAAMGELVPMPCVPVIEDPWVPGSPTVMVDGAPALTQSSKCECMWEGVIQIIAPSQESTQVAD
jgi:uncharacterized Zn-binding protein involved in type VI secretion